MNNKTEGKLFSYMPGFIFMFFDTETTGLPKRYDAPISDIDNWPRMVQLAWIKTDMFGHRICAKNYIIKPDNFIIPISASSVHGITTERANREGVLLTSVLDNFLQDFSNVDYIVGHNIVFDQMIIGAELIRAKKKETLEAVKSFCTMKAATAYCKIPGKYGYKYPSLKELHIKLFGKDFQDAHDAMNDVEATVKCFWEMKRRGLIKL